MDERFPAGATSGGTMRQEGYDEGHLRRYLLGELNEEEQQAVEAELLTDDESFDLLLAAEDELVDDYASGALSAEERKGFEGFFLSTSERQRKLSFAMALSRYITAEAGAVTTAAESAAASSRVIARPSPVIGLRSSWWKQVFSNPYLRMAAAAVVVLGLALGIWRAFFYQSDVAKGMAALAKAYRVERPTEARISGLNYAPLSNTRGAEQPKVDDLSLRRAERILLDEVAEHPSPASHHALGRLYLAERKFDKAIPHFDQALEGAPNNAQLHADYGAALLEMGKVSQSRDESGRSFEEFARSLEHLSKALDLNGSLLEALFNRALCHEYLQSYNLAKEDWKAYLEKDSGSKWADEAKQKLKELDERSMQVPQTVEQAYQELLDACRVKDDERTWKIITQNRDLSGAFIESRLIDDYVGKAIEGRTDEARKSIGALSCAGDVEYKQSGDKFISDLGRFYEQATTSQLNRISEAHALTKSARELYSKPDFDGALQSYRGAKEKFKNAGDACEATYAEFMIGSCYLGQSKPEPALALFESLARACERAQYRWLLAQTLMSLSNTNQFFRDFSAALDATNRSLSLSEEMGDAITVVISRYQLADIFRFLNNGNKALDLYARDLPLAQVYFLRPGQLWGRYFSISRALEELDLCAAAIDFQKEALQLAADAFATDAKASRQLCRSYNSLGFLQAKRGDYAGAVSSIERAIVVGNTLSERRVRLEATAFSFLQLGNVYKRAGDFDKAIQNYDKAIHLYDELDSKFFGFTVRKNKLLCCMEQSGCPAVKHEMEAVLDLFEKQRAKILEESNRNTFFDGEQSIYDVAIEFEYYKENDPAKAFEYSERSRGRSLSDLISTNVKLVDDPSPDMELSSTSGQMGLEEIQARIPERAQILQYAVLQNSVLIWIVSKDGFSSVPRHVSREELNNRVSNLVQLASNGSENDLEAFKHESMGLHDLLVNPIEDKIDSHKLLCIIPDKILNYLPFAALQSRETGTYLVESHDFVLSSSATMFVASSEFARAKETLKNESLASVGNPAFDRVRFANLPDLSAAAKEAATIAAYYGSTRPITGALATKERVVGEMEKSDVIHLATHAISEEGSPMRSKFLLARPSPVTAGKEADCVLQASDVYKLNLARARLVVLSACRTGVEKYYGGEGMIGLSRPFIAKRIPLVVASLWPVDSDATARLMTAFHRLRKAGGNTTVRALSLAQREMIGSSENDRLPRIWAAFVTIGGFASF